MSDEATKKPVISLYDVSFKRGERTIFSGLNFSIYAGEVIAILGPSGTGKTTLMRLITGQLQPYSGKVEVFGEDLSLLSESALMKMRQRMSMMFQSNALFSDMTLAENIAFPLREVLHVPEALIDMIVAMKLQAVGLSAARDLMPSELSGGMARRAALARAIAMDPEVMIYDEPFTGQDPITLGMLTLLLKDLNRSLNMVSLVVSHNIHEACHIADRALLLSGGKVVAFDTPERLLESQNELVAQFMHGKPDGPIPFHYGKEDYKDLMRGHL